MSDRPRVGGGEVRENAENAPDTLTTLRERNRGETSRVTRENGRGCPLGQGRPREGGVPPGGVETATCERCGVEFERRSGRGRPRKFCETCQPAIAQSDREAYNARRRAAYRVAHPPVVRRCSECGEEIVGRPDRVVCSRRCKDARYARLHPSEFAAARRRHDVRVRARRRGR
jgi:hypothetical protein